MNDNEVVKIDKVELEHQRLEEMLKGDYCEVRIVVPNVDPEKDIGKSPDKGIMPYIHITRHNINPLVVMIMIETLQEVIGEMEKDEPMLPLVRAMFGTKSMRIDNILTKNGKEVKEDE